MVNPQVDTNGKPSRFGGFVQMWAAMVRGEVAPDDTVACAYCEWAGPTSKFSPHLFTCPQGASDD